MSVFNKVFSFIFGCILVIIGVIGFTDGIGLTYVAKTVSEFWAYGVENTMTMLVGAIIFVVGIILVLANLCIKPPKSVKVPGGEKNNTVYVTLNTIENMAKATAMAVPGVVSVNTDIKSKRKGLSLRVRISVAFDDKINGVTEQLQNDIRSMIEGSTSLPVDSVDVLVVKAAGEKSAAAYRVENTADNSKVAETKLPFDDKKGDEL